MTKFCFGCGFSKLGPEYNLYKSNCYFCGGTLIREIEGREPVAIDINKLTWEEKWLLLNTITSIKIISPSPHQYYTNGVKQIWICRDGFSTSIRGDGSRPEGAIEGLFHKIFNAHDDEEIRVGDSTYLHWNGFGFTREDRKQ